MRVFVTGASGHIASALIPELIGAGHHVAGLARSDASAAAVASLGASVVRGDLDDLERLRDAAAASDGVIHLAFKHEALRTGDLSAAGEADLAATAAIGDALARSGRPFVNTSGTGMLASSAAATRAATENDVLASGYRVDTENATVALAARGVRSSVVRLPPVVHSDLDHHGFIPTLIGFARMNGRAVYIGDGANRWPAVHTRDAAHLYRLALESAPAGSRLHAVGDEGISLREIAAAIGSKLELPAASISVDEASQQLGFLAAFARLDNPTSSARSRALLSWHPTHPGLLEDIAAGHYFG